MDNLQPGDPQKNSAPAAPSLPAGAHSESKNHTSQLLGGTVSMAVANFLVMVIGLVIAMVATRNFSAETYGNFILLYLVSSFLTTLSTLGLDTTISRLLATGDDIVQQELMVNITLTLRWIMFGVTSIGALIFAPFLFRFFGIELGPATYSYAILLFFCDCFSLTLQSIQQGFFRFKQIAIWNFSSSVLNLALLFLLKYLPIDNLAILVFARWIAYFLAGIYLYISTPVKKRFVFQKERVLELVKFGFPLQINDILNYIYSRIDTIMIAAMLGPSNVAYFEIARKIPDSVITFFEAFRSAYFPTFSRLIATKEYGQAESLLKNALRLITFASLSIACVTFLFGKEIILLLFSPQYTSSIPLFVIISISMSLTLIGYLLGNSLVAVGESDKPAKINLIHAAISLCSNLLLIPPLGILGAGLTRLIGPTVTNPFNYIFLNKKFPNHVLSAYLKPIVIFAIWLGLASLIPETSILLKVIGILGFVLANYLFSVIKKSDFMFVQSEIGKILEKYAHKPIMNGNKP